MLYIDTVGRLETVITGDTLSVEITELLLDCCIELLYAEDDVDIGETVGNIENELCMLDVSLFDTDALLLWETTPVDEKEYRLELVGTSEMEGIIEELPEGIEEIVDVVVPDNDILDEAEELVELVMDSDVDDVLDSDWEDVVVRVPKVVPVARFVNELMLEELCVGTLDDDVICVDEATAELVCEFDTDAEILTTLLEELVIDTDDVLDCDAVGVVEWEKLDE
jgi:hypothetical protein